MSALNGIPSFEDDVDRMVNRMREELETAISATEEAVERYLGSILSIKIKTPEEEDVRLSRSKDAIGEILNSFVPALENRLFKAMDGIFIPYSAKDTVRSVYDPAKEYAVPFERIRDEVLPKILRLCETIRSTAENQTRIEAAKEVPPALPLFESAD